MKIAITGANGFVGSTLIKKFNGKFSILALSHKKTCKKIGGVNYKILDISNIIDSNKNIFYKVNTVIHTAAVVPSLRHNLCNKGNYDLINVKGTTELARKASNEGVKRFIFLSSVKVHGNNSKKGEKFISTDEIYPNDSYAKSKMHAELELKKLAMTTNMEIVIIRPALIYGPGVKGNYLSLMRFIYFGIPFPLKGINNKRSFLAIDNLVDLIEICIHHPLAGNKVFLASDGEDISISDLVIWLGIGLGKPTRIFSFPKNIMCWGFRCLGLKNISSQLFEDLKVDISDTRKVLGWDPEYKIKESTLATARWYKDNKC